MSMPLLLGLLQAQLPRAAWASLTVLVPHRGAASAVRQACRGQTAGRLPKIFNLTDPESMAAALGVPVPPPANSWPLRAHALRLLRAAHPALLPEALIPRTEGLLQSLNLLAEYGITPAQLRASVPDDLREVWATQGAVLLELWASAAPQAATALPAGRRRWLYAQLATCQCAGPVVQWGDCPSTPGLAALLAAWQPTALAYEAPPSPCVTLTARTPWEEIERLTLWVANQLGQGVQRLAVVATGPSAARLAVALQVRLGVRATTTGGTRWGETTAGQQVWQAALRWQGSPKELSLAYWLKELADTGLPPALEQLLADLATITGRMSGSLATAWVRQALESLASHAEDPFTPDPRVQILPPHAATLQPWEALAVAEVVEGTWPAQGAAGGLSPSQRRSLGLPDAASLALQAAATLAMLQRQGAAQVVFSRSETDSGGAVQAASRWWPVNAAPLPEPLTPAVWVRPRPTTPLGVFTPLQSPLRLSPSLLTDLMVCPYRAYAARVLKLAPLPPLQPTPDPRTRGLLLHQWLQTVALEFKQITPALVPAVTARLQQVAHTLLAALPPLEQALWAPRLKTLAPLIAARWAEQGRHLQPEHWLETLWDGLKIHAKADVVGQGPAGAVVTDYKTGQPPTLAAMRSGLAPQLPLEAWLLQRQGHTVAGLEYWHLKGFGPHPLPEVKTHAATPLTAPIEATLQALTATYFQPNTSWPAVPDLAGQGLVATGHCKSCAFSGLCRREAQR